LVILIGKVKTIAEGFDSKELRYAKSLMDRGDENEAKTIINNIINNSKDDNTVAEAMYCQVLWKFAKDERDTFERLKAYYPESKYVSSLESIVIQREKERRRLEALRGKEIGRDGRFIAYDRGTVLDTKTGLVWASKDNGENINWKDAELYCENYRGGGYTDWRLPTQDELEGLYDRSKSYQVTQKTYDVHLTELIELSACCPWAPETRGSGAAYFHFNLGYRAWGRQSFSFNRRALPVHSGK